MRRQGATGRGVSASCPFRPGCGCIHVRAGVSGGEDDIVKDKPKKQRDEKRGTCGSCRDGRTAAPAVPDAVAGAKDVPSPLEPGEYGPDTFVYWEEEFYEVGPCSDGHDLPFGFNSVRDMLRYLLDYIKASNEFLMQKDGAAPDTASLEMFIRETIASDGPPSAAALERVFNEYNAAYADTNPSIHVAAWGDLRTVLACPHAMERMEVRCGGEPWWPVFVGALEDGTFDPARNRRHLKMAREAVQSVYDNAG